MSSNHSHDQFRDAAGKRFSALALACLIALPLLPAVLAWVNHLTA